MAKPVSGLAVAVRHGHAAVELDLRLVDGIAGIRVEHLVAGVHEREDELADHRLAAGFDRHVVDAVGHAVRGADVGGQSLAQRRYAGVGTVAGPAVGDRLDRASTTFCRRRQIEVAEVERIDADCPRRRRRPPRPTRRRRSPSPGGRCASRSCRGCGFHGLLLTRGRSGEPPRRAWRPARRARPFALHFSPKRKRTESEASCFTLSTWRPLPRARSGTRPIAFRLPESFGGPSPALPLRRPSPARTRIEQARRRSLTRPSYRGDLVSVAGRHRLVLSSSRPRSLRGSARGFGPQRMPGRSSCRSSLVANAGLHTVRRARPPGRPRRPPSRGGPPAPRRGRRGEPSGSPRRSHGPVSGLRRQETGTSRPMRGELAAHLVHEPCGTRRLTICLVFAS